MESSGLNSKLENTTDEWAGRCEYWLGNSPQIKKRKRREREIQPLILTGHGISFSVHRGTLLIQDGNTHYPSSRRIFRFFKGELSLPPRIILVGGSGNLTFEALDWLSAQKIALIRVGWNGHIGSVIATSGYAADQKKVAWQIAARSNEKKRVEFAVPLIEKKIKATLFNLKNILPPSHSRDKAIDTAQTALTTLENRSPSNISKLLLAEGQVAAGYFFAWRALELRWKELGRFPIPDDWKRFFSRSSLKRDVDFGNRYATHPINSMLNYAYALLESVIRIEAIAKGHDPSLGIMHTRNTRDRHSFVFDLMEPFRPIADRIILKLINEEIFTGADFVLQKDGVCRLNPNLARHIVREVERLHVTHQFNW